MLQNDRDYFEESYVDYDPDLERKLSLICAAKRVNCMTNIPVEIRNQIEIEYESTMSAISSQIAEKCEAEGYPPCGSNFDLRVEARQTDFDLIFEEIWLKHGYIVDGEM